MRTKIVCFLLIGCIFFTACSKSGAPSDPGNTNPDPDPPPDFLIHTSYSAGYTPSGNFNYKIGRNFNYDKTNNTVTVYEKDTFGINISFDTIVCKLKNDSITINHLAIPFKQTYFLNKSHSQIDSLHTVNDNLLINYTYNYTINAKGKLLTNKSTGVVYTNGVAGSPTIQTTNYTWNDVNLTKYTSNFETVNYTYNQNVLAAQPDPLLIAYDPPSYLNQSEDVIETSSETYSTGSTVNNFQYKYDENGRIVSINGTSTDGSTYFITDTYY